MMQAVREGKDRILFLEQVDHELDSITHIPWMRDQASADKMFEHLAGALVRARQSGSDQL